MYSTLIKPYLFKKDPEEAHHFTFSLIQKLFKIPLVAPIMRALYHYQDPKLEREVFGLKFPNPIGIAAGFDKNAMLIDQLPNYGFGFVEVGTVTPKPQEGNPKPRLFRLPKDKAIINRMGFNNEGVDVLVERLKNRKGNVIIGGNIGKNKTTPNEEAVNDYLICFEKLFDYVDYFVVNVSSPNTPNLRALQEKEPLKRILQSLQNKNKDKSKAKPILLKIAPDLSDQQLDDIIEIVTETNIAGVIATNTTIARAPLSSNKNEVEKIGAGGLSGKPLRQRSTEVIHYLNQKSQGVFPIIGVGGINSPLDALEKINAGASLIQVYTGFVYEGPSICKEINKVLVQNL